MKHFLVFVTFLLAGIGAAPALPEPAAGVTVDQVIDAQTVATQEGKALRLAGIQAPGMDAPMGADARAWLENRIKGRRVQLRALEPPDRHGQRRAALYDKGIWVQEAMVGAGMAMVDDSATPALLSAEAAARKAGRGIWAVPYYAPAPAHRAGERAGRYTLVEGVVVDAAKPKDHWYINFGTDWKTDFTGFIARKYARRFKNYDLAGLKGKRVRLRGWVYEHSGPAMDINAPAQIEILE